MNHGFAKHTLLKPCELIQLDSHIMIFIIIMWTGMVVFFDFFHNIIQLFFL